MTTDEKLAAILAAIQTDPGNRGLARDPEDNLFNACHGDFAKACRSIASDPSASLALITGFYIPTAGAFETDGPLGVVFLARTATSLGLLVSFAAEPPVCRAIEAVIGNAGFRAGTQNAPQRITHQIWIERAGPASDGRKYTMRGTDISEFQELELKQLVHSAKNTPLSIGIGDGGNEMGMGKILRETITKNITNGELIHCRVPTDLLIVAGVSNWGAYALAAGIFVVRDIKPPPGLFVAESERQILESMVREGPLVDGVTGKPTATVDGLTWDEYIKPFIRIREILEV